MIEHNKVTADRWGPSWLFEGETDITAVSPAVVDAGQAPASLVAEVRESAENSSTTETPDASANSAATEAVEPDVAQGWSLGLPFEPVPADHLFIRRNEYYWMRLAPFEVWQLTRLRKVPDPCVCCGGRLKHGRSCEMMRQAGLGVVEPSRGH